MDRLPGATSNVEYKAGFTSIDIWIDRLPEPHPMSSTKKGSYTIYIDRWIDYLSNIKCQVKIRVNIHRLMDRLPEPHPMSSTEQGTYK